MDAILRRGIYEKTSTTNRDGIYSCKNQYFTYKVIPMAILSHVNKYKATSHSSYINKRITTKKINVMPYQNLERSTSAGKVKKLK